MKKLTLTTLLLSSFLLAIQVKAETPSNAICYQLSSRPDAWSRTAELACFERINDNGLTKITLAIDEMGLRKVIGQFELDYLSGVKCIECIKDTYGIANPSNSVFNKLSVIVDGTRDLTGNSQGTIKFGDTVFYFKNY